MNSNIEALAGLGIDALREVAKGKIKSYAKFNKAGLYAALVEHFTAEQAAADAAAAAEAARVAAAAKPLIVALEAEETAKPAKKAQTPKKGTATPKQVKARKECNIQGCTRKPGPASNGGMCDPHFTEGGWENAHNDEAHEDSDEPVADCWVCCPELNLAAAPARKGTSRIEMRLTVPVHAAGGDKADAVIERLLGMYPHKVSVVEDDEDGELTKLVIKGGKELGKVTLYWGETGAYDYSRSDCNGNKVRNASAALRYLGL